MVSVGNTAGVEVAGEAQVGAHQAVPHAVHRLQGHHAALCDAPQHQAVALSGLTLLHLSDKFCILLKG